MVDCPHGVTSRTSVTSDVDALMPHLYRLFSVWLKRDSNSTNQAGLLHPNHRAMVSFASTSASEGGATDAIQPCLSPTSDHPSSLIGGGGGPTPRSDTIQLGEEFINGGTSAMATTETDPSWWGADVLALLSDSHCQVGPAVMCTDSIPTQQRNTSSNNLHTHSSHTTPAHSPLLPNHTSFTQSVLSPTY